jgi:DNA polymerase III subunit epsilon
VLRELDVLVLDCQATGATPAHGDLLELGWAVCGDAGLAAPAKAHWIVPRSDRGVPSAVRKLTGWTDDCASVAVDPLEAWRLLRSDVPVAHDAPRRPVPTVIHFARFELPFLRELHEHAQDAGEPFPFDTICLHAIAQRLLPDLPRRNLRALAGHLGHSPDLARRAAGHVEASAFIWRALLPALDMAGIRTWDELKTWLQEPAPLARPRGTKRSFPLSVERRRSLPDAPGVYRFLRPNGDVLYVGKAASLKKRVASHFTAASRATHERALEMLSQAHDVAITATESVLEAALLETDEIKRIDPPYNVQLRTGDRRAWFASRDWRSALPFPDDECSVGPLPSERAVSGIGAMRALLDGASADDELRAAAVGVPPRWAPEARIFDEAWQALVRDELPGPRSASTRARILRAAARIAIVLADAEDLEAEEPAAPSGWDPEQVRRALERTVAQEARLVFRAHALCLLSESVVVFREPRMAESRVLVVRAGEIVERGEIEVPRPVPRARCRPAARRARQASFDAARYDRLRVLVTELRRIADQGGDVAVHVGNHLFRTPERPRP